MTLRTAPHDNQDMKLFTMFLHEPQLPKNNRKNNHHMGETWSKIDRTVVAEPPSGAVHSGGGVRLQCPCEKKLALGAGAGRARERRVRHVVGRPVRPRGELGHDAGHTT